MIIDLVHTWDAYDEITKQHGLNQYKCPMCFNHNTLTRHGYYQRHILIPVENIQTEVGGEDLITDVCLKILRVKCKTCKSTHAILTSDMIPRMVYSYPCILMLLLHVIENGGSVLCAQQETGVSYQTLYRFISILKF